MSQRAIETLRTADYVAAEDTRKTGLLLKHFGIEDKPMLSFYEHNEAQAGRKILALLDEGKTVALCTSAGTPGISDPGYTLVRKAIDAHIKITLIPGPAAFVMALVLSGLPVHSFTFRGFAPRQPGKRQKFLQADALSPHTLIYYESPFRLREFLQDALAVFGDRDACLANDLTKLFETVERGTLSQLSLAWPDGEATLKGEYVVVIAGAARD